MRFFTILIQSVIAVSGQEEETRLLYAVNVHFLE